MFCHNPFAQFRELKYNGCHFPERMIRPSMGVWKPSKGESAPFTNYLDTYFSWT